MAKKLKVDPNENARLALAKRILDGETINDMGRLIKLYTIEIDDKPAYGYPDTHKYFARLHKDGNVVIPGRGDSKVNAVIDTLLHLESMGVLFKSYTYNSNEPVKKGKKSASKAKKAIAKNKKKMKALPFL